MRRGRVLAWLGAFVVLATAVVALRESQPVLGPLPAAPSTTPTGPVRVARFAVDGVSLPEPSERPAPPATVEASRTGPRRLRVAWGRALPGGADPANTTGYEVRWSSLATGAGGSRLVAAPEVELELDDLRDNDDYAVEVRSVDAFGRRSTPTTAVAGTDAERIWEPRRLTGMYEPFDGPFSVDTAVVGARWHLSGYPGCTVAAADGGVLALNLECGDDLAVLRARSPMLLTGAPGVPGAERGRLVLVTDAAGPTGALTVDLVPGPADQAGAGDADVPPPGNPANATAVVDPALPDGTLRVLIDDGGARVITGPDVPGLPASPAPGVRPAPARGVGVLHVFEVVIDGDGVRVLQDGEAVAAAGVVPSWTQANLLIGISGPPGRQSRVRLDAVGFTGPATAPPPTYAHPVVPATQRVLGIVEGAPNIGITRRQLATAATARLVATVNVVPGVDINGLVLQHGDVRIPARPVLPSMPSADGAQVTVAAELPAALLGPGGPESVSPLVLRAPGADTAMVPITGSYLEIVPLPGYDVPRAVTPSRRPRPPAPAALPRPSVRLLDSTSHVVSTAAPGARLVIEVTLDGLGGQLDGARLAGVAGFQVWLDTRQVAGVPTALDGAGVGGVYRVALSTRQLSPGAHFIELRLISADPSVKTVSTLASWQLS